MEMETLLRTPKLLPLPQKAVWGNGFLDWSKAEFNVDENGLPVGDFLSIETAELPFSNSLDAYGLSILPDGIIIRARDERGVRMALATLRQIGMQADSRGFRFCEIEDFPNADIRAFSLDLSAGKIPTLEDLKLLVDRLSLFKFNRLECNLTNAYPFAGHESEWAARAVMPPSKILRLKDYCLAQGMSLSLAFDAAKFGADLTLEVASHFDCRDINICGKGRGTAEISKVSDVLCAAGYNPIYFTDVIALENSSLQNGMPIFSSNNGDAFVSACAKAKECGIDFCVSYDCSLSKFPDYENSKKNIQSAFDVVKSGARGLITNVSLGDFSPMCSIYAPALWAASASWSVLATDESVCEALDGLVFYEENGDFSRALFALGNVVKSELLYDIFFAQENQLLDVLSLHKDIDFDVLESSADFALALAATAKIQSRDVRILSAEFALTGAMMKWAVCKARGNIDKVALKFIIADFENIWLSRCECGGMWEASAKLRALTT